MQFCFQRCNTQMACNSKFIESRKASLSWFLSSGANNSCPLLSVALCAQMMKKKKPAFHCWNEYNATDSSGYELPAWGWGDALWLEGNQCSCKCSGGSQWIPCHLCKFNFETFVSQNLSCMTRGTTVPLVGTTWWSARAAFEDEENRDKEKTSRCV